MVGVFKRAAGMQGAFSTSVPAVGGRELEGLVEECLRCYTGLVVGSGFMEFEEERGVGGNGIGTGGTGVGGLMGRAGYAGGFS